MKRITIIIIISFFVFNSSFAQIDKIYLGTCGNESISDIELINKDLYIVGKTSSFDWGIEDAIVLKNNGISNNCWIKLFKVDNHSDEVKDIEILDDSTFIFTGSRFVKGSYPFIVKMDTSGTIIWNKELDSSQYPGDEAIKIIKNPDNELLLAINSGPDTNEICYYYFKSAVNIIKLNAKGEIIQSKYFYIGLNDPANNRTSVTDFILAKDSGYIITGTTHFPNYQFILKLDNQLNMIWYKVLRMGFIFQKMYNIVMVDDGYITLGNVGFPESSPLDLDNNPYLTKFDFNGNLRWIKVFSNSGTKYLDPKSLSKIGNRLYVTATKNYFQRGSNHIVACLNFDGDIIWSKELGDYESSNVPNKIISYNDTLYLVGTSNTNDLMNRLSPLTKQKDIEFIKLDTTQEYFSQFHDFEIETMQMNLDTTAYPFQSYDHDQLFNSPMLSMKDVNFQYDSLQCQIYVDINKIELSTLKINIYPNPCSQILSISGSNNANNVSLQLLDISGKILVKKNYYKLPCQIDISNLENGIYILKIQIENQIFIKKVIKN